MRTVGNLGRKPNTYFVMDWQPAEKSNLLCSWFGLQHSEQGEKKIFEGFKKQAYLLASWTSVTFVLLPKKMLVRTIDTLRRSCVTAFIPNTVENARASRSYLGTQTNPRQEAMGQIMPVSQPRSTTLAQNLPPQHDLYGEAEALIPS